MYKQDLALINLQGLICHKTQPNQTRLDHNATVATETFVVRKIMVQLITVSNQMIHEISRFSMIKQGQIGLKPYIPNLCSKSSK